MSLRLFFQPFWQGQLLPLPAYLSKIFKKEIQIMNQQAKIISPPIEEECAICLLPCVKPVICRGPCRKLFCIKCVAQSIKRSKNACPNRCSEPFQVEMPNPVLICPYSPEDCNITISSPKHLTDHYQICLFISPEERHAEQLKKSYKCSKGHSLVFMDQNAFQIVYGGGTSTMTTNEECSQCKNLELCRSLCLTCSSRDSIVIYCCECRPLPCTKTQCPMGHRLRKSNKVGKNRYCDLCDVPALLTSKTAYGYCRCDFDLCESCHANLPDYNPVIPVRYNPRKLIELSYMQEVDSESQWKQK